MKNPDVPSLHLVLLARELGGSEGQRVQDPLSYDIVCRYYCYKVQRGQACRILVKLYHQVWAQNCGDTFWLVS